MVVPFEPGSNSFHGESRFKLHYPYIDGYKPLGNYQALLGQVVQERLSAATGLQRIVETTVTAEVERVPDVGDIMSIVVPVTVRDGGPARLYDRPSARVARPRQNYLEAETRNQSLGLAGEELVLRFERERLRRAGGATLADRIEHVSQTQGDGVGYDIQSFELDGRNRLIEVKTTRFRALTPFFASRNEVEVSEERSDECHVYRLFRFRVEPRLFTLAVLPKNSAEVICGTEWQALSSVRFVLDNPTSILPERPRWLHKQLHRKSL
jgi:uncharacterized protein DUF3883